MYITLEDKDCLRIAEDIANADYDATTCYVSIDDIDFEIEFRKDVTSEEENGGWYTTDATVVVYDVSVCGSKNTAVDVNTSVIEKYSEDFLLR